VLRKYKTFLVKAIYFLEALFLKKDSLCPYCHENHFEIVSKKAYLIDICHCLCCGLYWTNPIFRLYKFYNFIYEAEDCALALPKNKDLQKLLSSNFREIEKEDTLLIGWLKKNAKGRKLLEFGSAWGYFLYQAQKEGFDAIGVEISKKKRIFGRDKLKVKIIPNMDILLSAGERYDIIVTFDTLEHLPSVSSIFRTFNALLNKGGILVIDTLFLKEVNKYYMSKMGAVHPLGFSKEFFEKNMPKEGFRLDFWNQQAICTKIS